MVTGRTSARIKYLEVLSCPDLHDALMRCAHHEDECATVGPGRGSRSLRPDDRWMVGTFLWLTITWEARSHTWPAQIGARFIYVNVGIGLCSLFLRLLCFTMWAFLLRRGHAATSVRGFRSSVAGMLKPPSPGVPAPRNSHEVGNDGARETRGSRSIT